MSTYLADGGVPRYQALLGIERAPKSSRCSNKPGSVDSAELAPHADITGLIDEWLSDVDGDGYLEPYHFTRDPLVVNVVVGGELLQLVVAHTKSNYVNNGEELWNDPLRQHRVHRHLPQGSPSHFDRGHADASLY